MYKIFAHDFYDYYCSKLFWLLKEYFFIYFNFTTSSFTYFNVSLTHLVTQVGHKRCGRYGRAQVRHSVQWAEYCAVHIFWILWVKRFGQLCMLLDDFHQFLLAGKRLWQAGPCEQIHDVNKFISGYILKKKQKQPFTNNK